MVNGHRGVVAGLSLGRYQSGEHLRAMCGVFLIDTPVSPTQREVARLVYACQYSTGRWTRCHRAARGG